MISKAFIKKKKRKKKIANIKLNSQINHNLYKVVIQVIEED